MKAVHCPVYSDLAIGDVIAVGVDMTASFMARRPLAITSIIGVLAVISESVGDLRLRTGVKPIELDESLAATAISLFLRSPRSQA